MDKQVLYYILFLLAGLLWATMDEIQFHFSKLFGKVIKNKKLLQWFDPHISWRNKYKSKSKLVRWLLSKPLAFVTDFWHLLKAGLIFDISLFGVLATGNPWWYSILVFIAFGILEEIVWWTYNVINYLRFRHKVKHTLKSTVVVSKEQFVGALAKHRPGKFLTWVYDNFGKMAKQHKVKRLTISLLVILFLGGFISTIVPGLRIVTAIATLAYGGYLFVIVGTLLAALIMNNIRIRKICKYLGISKSKYNELIDKYIID